MKNREKNRMYTAVRLLLAGAIVAAFLLFFEKREEKIHPDAVETEETETLTQEESSESLPVNAVLEEDTEAAEAAALRRESERLISLSAGELAASGIVRQELVDLLFFADEIDESVFARIDGSSYTENDNIARSELSYLRMLYYGFDGNTYIGEMIVNRQIADTVLAIFKTLYENQYPIERMVLVDEYGANDGQSMEHNNTSAFNYRNIAGSSRLSNHSYGMAVDLNPKYNPYVKTAGDGSVICQPESGIDYADRSKSFAHKIDENDLAYRLFTEAGFDWGGNWKSVKDYQHFEKVTD